MKKQWTGFVNEVPVILLAVLAVFTAASWFWDQYIFIAHAAVFVLVLGYSVARMFGARRDAYRQIQRVASGLNTVERDVLAGFPLPVLVLGDAYQVLWYNPHFRDTVLLGRDMVSTPFSRILPDVSVDALINRPTDVGIGTRRYTLYAHKTDDSAGSLYMLYFIDDTTLKNTFDEYKLSRPCVGLVVLDNLEDLLQGAKEGERPQLSGRIETIIERSLALTSGFLRKVSNDRYLFIIEERHLAEMVQARFSLLDEVRTVVASGRMSATLSIGIGHGGDTLRECEDMARQALDMALGRGGDQVAVRSKNGYEFYGGVSKGVEKRTKVRSRIIANALSELIDGSDNVLIMGHRASDLDALGAAYGLYSAIRAKQVPVHIVVRRGASMATELIDRIFESGSGEALLEPERALGLVTKRTLVIITDTHSPAFVESPEIYKACKNIVVIDHHRKMVEHIDNAVIFFHEPYASSASEMVAELLQYLNESSVGQFEAEALLAGIMLDTKNFVIRTGVRTFEAAAFLRRKGADTVEVRKLFASSIDVYQRKAEIVSAAKIYKSCAVSVSSKTGSVMRRCAAQAADELLGINGVDASFVLYRDGTTSMVSGRSLGAVNVQLIMEGLGGGGHLTMAGAQLENTQLDDARAKLIQAIDTYTENRKIESTHTLDALKGE